MCHTCVYASMTIVTCPGVSRNSIGYGCVMIPGSPGGRQLAASVSSGALATYAFLLASYCGVRAGPAGGAAPRAPPPRSQTPVRSGNFARAAQSLAVGAFVVTFCGAALNESVAETNAATTSAAFRGVARFMRAKVA